MIRQIRKIRGALTLHPSFIRQNPLYWLLRSSEWQDSSPRLQPLCMSYFQPPRHAAARPSSKPCCNLLLSYQASPSKKSLSHTNDNKSPSVLGMPSDPKNKSHQIMLATH